MNALIVLLYYLLLHHEQPIAITGHQTGLFGDGFCSLFDIWNIMNFLPEYVCQKWNGRLKVGEKNEKSEIQALHAC